MARRLLLLNGLAVLGVVVNHATGWGFTALIWWTNRYLPVAVPDYAQIGTATYYALRVLEQLVAFTVPSFLFASGFFIAFVVGRDVGEGDWSIVRSRIAILVVPYVIWSIVILAGRAAEGRALTPGSVLSAIAFGRAAAPFYYIPLLVQLYLLAPFLIRAVRRHWAAVLAAAAAVQLSTHALQYAALLGDGTGWLRPQHVAPAWLFATKVFWFVLGIVVCLRLATTRAWLVRTRWAWLAVLVLTFAAGLWEWEALLGASGRPWIAYFDTAVDGGYAAAFIACFVAFEGVVRLLPERVGALGAASYAVYLIHAPAQELAARAVATLAPALLQYQWLFQPLLWCVGLAVPLLLMTAVQAGPARRLYRPLFG
jgi:peptidoglycan/LPS O-acetylase OafA/YrhL